MAEIVKPKDLAKVLESIPEGQLSSAAEELGMTSKQLSGFLNKPTTKTFQKIAETLGEGIESAQKFVDKFIRKEPTELEKIGMKAAEGGVTPPKVQPEFAKEELGKERGFQMPGQPGGPLATVEQPGQLATIPPPATTQEQPGQLSPRMTGLGQKLEAQAPKPLELPPAGRKEEAIRPSPETQMAQDSVTKAPMSVVPPSKKMAGGMAAGAAAAGLGLFSQEASAPTVIKEAGVDKPADASGVVQQAAAMQATEPEKQTVLEQQAKQLDAVAQSIEAKLTSDYEKKQARLELMKLTETVMHGLVTALGANALLNKNSPFAIDFSQGPRTDWNAQFDRLQKDYATQLGALTQKYKLESAEKRAAAAEAGRESRFERSMALREQELAAKGQRAAETAAEKAAQKKAKIEADATGLIEKISALEPSKDAGQMAAARGQLFKITKQLFTPDEQKQVEARAAELAQADKSMVREFFRSLGVISKEPGKKEYAQLTNAYAQAVKEKLLPESAPAAAAPAAPAGQEGLVDMVAPDGRKLKVPASRVQELEARGAKRS